MKTIRLTAEAGNDIDEIWLFIAQDDPDAADRFHDILMSKFALLGKQPLIGRERNDLSPSLRSFPVGNYVIFYRDWPEVLEIMRVLHGARDIENTM